MDKLLNDGVFTKIVGTRTTKSSYDLFVEQEKLFSPTDDQLTEFTGKYNKLINENKELFQLLSSMEEVIMQLRSLEVLDKNIKYSVGGRNREYIYARVPFYRHGHNKNPANANIYASLAPFTYALNAKHLVIAHIKS